MQIKLLALDMDGTTLQNDHATLSPANRAAIEAAIAKGVEVVVATGRTFGRMPEQMLAVKGLRYALISNGAAVIELPGGRQLYQNPVTKAALIHTLEAVAPFHIYVECYSAGMPHIDAHDANRLEEFPLTPGRLAMIRRSTRVVDNLHAFMLDEQNQIEKLNFPYIAAEQYDAVWAALRALPEVAVTTSVSLNAEVNNLTACKADGLRHLCGLLGIAPAQVMAVGDAGNDLEMLRFAGVGVAMGNATDEVKAAAAYCTETNENDGVARAIERLIL